MATFKIERWQGNLLFPEKWNVYRWAFPDDPAPGWKASKNVRPWEFDSDYNTLQKALEYIFSLPDDSKIITLKIHR